jgi:hypothetical protein
LLRLEMTDARAVPLPDGNFRVNYEFAYV